MRKKINILLIFIVTISSCNKNLNIEPISIVSSTSMWKTSDDAKGAMYGMYSQLRSTMSDNYAWWGDYRSGLFTNAIGTQGGNQNIFNNTLTRQNKGTNWDALYRTINDCNLILKHTPTIPFNKEGEKEIVLANAHFVRALCYFYCARIWGNVPIVLSGYESDKQSDLYPTRSPIDSVYRQILSDINQSISLFSEDSYTSSKIGSMAAVNMLKADFNLWVYKTGDHNKGNLTQANEAVDQVLSNANFSLQEKYENVFRNDDNNEIIFALNFDQNEYTGGFPADYLVPQQFIQTKSLINNPIQIGSHQQWVCFTDDFENTIYEDSRDTRSKISLDTFVDPGNNTKFRWINKYLGEFESNTRLFTSDIKIYRYAEAILFKAEIENAMGNTTQAIEELNKIAKRAYKVDNYYPNSMSREDLDKKILNERLKEFAAEGKSWFDMIRFGVVFDSVKSLAGKEDKENILLWPVNEESINSNPNIKQTPGYN